jgi:hypothetical protein
MTNLNSVHKIGDVSEIFMLHYADKKAIQMMTSCGSVASAWLYHMSVALF